MKHLIVEKNTTLQNCGCKRFSESCLSNKTGIRTSCANKRKLYLIYRKNNNPNHKEYYKKYCKILSKFIVSAKKYYYNNLITKSNNKPKTTWNIVKTNTKNKKTANNITTMNVNNKPTSNPLTIVNAFNSYFLSVAENLLKKIFLNQTQLIIMTHYYI